MPDATSHDQIRELLPWFVNDTLDEPERRRVAAHLPGCRVCRDDLAALTAVRQALLVDGVEPIVPSTDPLQLIGGEPRESPSRQRRGLPLWPLAAAAAGITAVIIATQADLFPGVVENRQFETATSTGAMAEAGYILKIEFSISLPDRERDAIVAKLDGVSGWSVDEAESWSVRLEIAEPTLAALEDIENEVAAMPGVESARFVAVQIPVR